MRSTLRFAIALCLILAASGLQWPAYAPRTQLVVLADVSESIFDPETQNAQLQELLSPLDRARTEAAICVFGAQPGVERAMAPLPALSATRTRRSESLLPNLARSTVFVDPGGTDIAASLNLGRTLFTADKENAARAILMLSDYRSTRGDARAAAALLRGDGIALLAAPAVLGVSADVHIAALRLPDKGSIGRALPIEVTVSALKPCSVRVGVLRERSGESAVPVDFKLITFTAEPGSAEQRRTVRFLDVPQSPGTAIYTARISGADGELPGDLNINNELSGAVRVEGPSRWAVLAVPGSTLARMVQSSALGGVNATLFSAEKLPTSRTAYDPFAGLLVDGLSAAQLPDGPALRAIADAVKNGKAVVALGGAKAFGAGGHREGTWEQLLPAHMTPEDDRTRSVLFLIDVSKSMEQREGSGVRKIDFAGEQLALALQSLKPSDSVGLITFSGTALLAAPLSSDASHVRFLDALKKIQIEQSTDLLPALKLAQETLKKDDAEEQIVVLLSDGVQTVSVPREQIIEAAAGLCAKAPGVDKRRTTLYAFGIESGSGGDPTGEKLLRDLATAGGGWYSAEFLKLGERLKQAFEEQNKDFYSRTEHFNMQRRAEHSILAQADESAKAGWPQLPFRNRVKAKSEAETLLSAAGTKDESVSKKEDPILIVSGTRWAGMGRSALLGVSLEGDAGTAFLENAQSRRLLSATLEWAEGRGASTGWIVNAEARSDDTLGISVQARDAKALPINNLKLSASLTALLASPAPSSSSLMELTLAPQSPGVYAATLPAPPRGVYRLAIQNGIQAIHEQFLSVPYGAEYRRFGVDRAEMQELAARAGGNSQVIENPQQLAAWAQASAARAPYSLRPALIIAAIALLLAEIALRGRRF